MRAIIGDSFRRLVKPGAIIWPNKRSIAYGANLIANGDFGVGTGWAPGTNWSIAGGVAHVNNTGGTSMTQTVTLVPGVMYRVRFTVLNYVSGGVFARLFGGTPVVGVNRQQAGTFEDYLIATAGNTQLAFTSQTSGTTVLDIDNVTLQPQV